MPVAQRTSLNKVKNLAASRRAALAAVLAIGYATSRCSAGAPPGYQFGLFL